MTEETNFEIENSLDDEVEIVMVCESGEEIVLLNDCEDSIIDSVDNFHIEFTHKNSETLSNGVKFSVEEICLICKNITDDGVNISTSNTGTSGIPVIEFINKILQHSSLELPIAKGFLCNSCFLIIDRADELYSAGKTTKQEYLSIEVKIKSIVKEKSLLDNIKPEPLSDFEELDYVDLGKVKEEIAEFEDDDNNDSFFFVDVDNQDKENDEFLLIESMNEDGIKHDDNEGINIQYKKGKSKGLICKCKICQIEFDERGEYLGHVRYYHKDIYIICNVCQAIFAKEESYQKHLKLIHQIYPKTKIKKLPSNIQVEDIYKYFLFDNSEHCCKFCDTAFESKKDFMKHFSDIHQYDYSLQCQLCYCEITSGINNFILHFALVHYDHSLEVGCGLIKMLVNEQYGYNFDLNPHEHVCVVCYLLFEDRETLLEHRRNSHKRTKIVSPKLIKESGITILNCPLCHTQIDKLSFKKHINIAHTNVEIYKCTLCPEDFPSYALLRKHKRNKHSVGLIKKKHSCPICQRMFNTPSYVKAHIVIQHENRRNYTCESCGMSFYRPQHLREHKLRYHDGKKRLRCKLCGKEFLISSSVRNHIRKIHKITDIPRIDDASAQHILPFERINS